MGLSSLALTKWYNYKEGAQKVISKEQIASYEQMGIAALLPGMQFMVERMQKELDAMKLQLAGLQNGRDQVTPLGQFLRAEDSSVRKMMQKRGRPGRSRRSSGWPDDPEERKVESARRRAVSLAKQKAKQKEKELPAQNKDSPKHEAWVKKLRASQRRYWNNLTATEKKNRIAKLTAARRKQKAA
jgi:hypothetical protein